MLYIWGIIAIFLFVIPNRSCQNPHAKAFDNYSFDNKRKIAISEACEAYLKKKEDLGEELADVVIYIMGLAEILGFDLEKEIINKIEKNEKRKYINKDGYNIRAND